MKTTFFCPVNSGTQLVIHDDKYNKDVSLSIIGPWGEGFREELVVNITPGELTRFKEAVAAL